MTALCSGVVCLYQTGLLPSYLSKRSVQRVLKELFLFSVNYSSWERNQTTVQTAVSPLSAGCGHQVGQLKPCETIVCVCVGAHLCFEEMQYRTWMENAFLSEKISPLEQQARCDWEVWSVNFPGTNVHVAEEPTKHQTQAGLFCIWYLPEASSAAR